MKNTQNELTFDNKRESTKNVNTSNAILERNTSSFQRRLTNISKKLNLCCMVHYK